LTNQLNHRNSKLALILALIFSTLLVLSSCSSKSNSGNKTPTELATREITDDAGNRLRVPQKIERVVSLAPNLTEIVFAVGGGSRLVGNTTFCNYPPEAQAVAKVGDTMQPNLETVIALRPQLVLVSTASQLEAFTRRMEEQNIPVYVTDPHDLEGVFHTIQMLGELLGENERAAVVVRDLRARSDAVSAAVRSRQSVTVFYQTSAKPLYTAGRDSFITDIVRRAGGRSVTADVAGAWPKFSDESALASQPEAIIIPSYDSMNKEDTKVADSLAKSPAAKNGRVYGINGDYLSRPGPRLVNGLEEMARKLHPDAFK
jgi:iron complex transport system substrate-binding protein